MTYAQDLAHALGTLGMDADIYHSGGGIVGVRVKLPTAREYLLAIAPPLPSP